MLVHDPSGALEPHKVHELLGSIQEASGLPVGLYCQGAAGNALVAALEAARAGADRIATAVFPVALTVHRVSGESLADALGGLGIDTGIDVDALWRASDLVDEYIGDEPVTPLPPRDLRRAPPSTASPPGLVAALDMHLRANAAGDRIDEVLAELELIRGEAGSPPLAAPIGQVLASQALLHVLSAERYQTVVDEFRDLIEGKFGTPPAPFDPAIQRAVALTADDEPEEELDFDELREDAAGLASSEEELILLAMFGEEAEPLLRAIRARATGRRRCSAAPSTSAAPSGSRISSAIVQESGVAEITVEEGDLRVTVRRTEDRPALVAAPTHIGVAEPLPPGTAAVDAASNGFLRVESPMVGTFYRAPEPGAAAFVEEGDVVSAGQTLCILEAMKLMNHVKADAAGTVRTIAVGNGEAVEFGQLLFEIEPAPVAAPLDAV